MLPGQHLELVALAGGVPVQVDAEGLELDGGAVDPPLVVVVLPPAVEAPAVEPDGLDDAPDPAVAAGQQALDLDRKSVV